MELKWTIQELIKNSKTNTDLNFDLDLKKYITKKHEDLVDISITQVEGFYDYYESEALFVFDLNIKTELTMLCSLTLEEILVKLEFNSQLNFSKKPLDDNTHLIEGITIDIDQCIFSEIMIEKPMNVYAPKARQNYHEDVHEMDEEELVSVSPFAKLNK